MTRRVTNSGGDHWTAADQELHLHDERRRLANDTELARQRELGLCVRGCDDERSDGPFCARCGNDRNGEAA